MTTYMQGSADTALRLIFEEITADQRGFHDCFAASDKLWPRIYPLETELMAKTEASPMLCMYSAQMAPAPAPPTLASQTVVQCQPLKVILETLLIVSSKSARRNMEMLRAFLVVNGCGSFAFNTGQVISSTFYF
jgi:hypothetical protein